MLLKILNKIILRNFAEAYKFSSQFLVRYQALQQDKPTLEKTITTRI